MVWLSLQRFHEVKLLLLFADIDRTVINDANILSIFKSSFL